MKEEVSAALAELAALDRPALALRWQSVFGVPAPKSCQAPLLRGALAWHVQVSIHQANANRASKALARAASFPLANTLTPGTRLLREWQGRTHHVTVVGDGFEYEGRHWKSLSAITRSITGTRWSGPRFFGLRS
jgi:hypothetical protein